MPQNFHDPHVVQAHITLARARRQREEQRWLRWRRWLTDGAAVLGLAAVVYAVAFSLAHWIAR